MRILYFHQYFSTRDGAAGTRSYEFAKALIERGHSVTVVCSSYAQSRSGLTGEFKRGRREGIVEEIKVIELELAHSNRTKILGRAVLFLRYALQSAWLALTLPCDLVFATSTPLTAGIPGALAKWFRFKPFVFEVRDLWPELPKAMGVIRNRFVLWSLGLLERFLYLSADACVGLSPGIVEGIKQKCDADKKVMLIPNGCDLDLFVPKESVKSSDEFVAIFCGAHGQANGLDAVIEAGRLLKKSGNTKIKLHFIGDGSQKERLQRVAKEENLDNCVFLSPLPKKELAQKLSQADVGLMILANIPAFYFGTSPNKFFDYIASGLPVVVNYPGWLAEMVDRHHCGFAVSPEDPQALADALIKLQSEPELLVSMGRRSRMLAESNLRRKQLCMSFVNLLEEQKNESLRVGSGLHRLANRELARD